MFERFTHRARRVVVLGQEESRIINHNVIGTEHLLAGLVHEGEGVACRALVSLGVTLEVIRNLILEIDGKGGSSPSGHIPFTPRCKKVLELSLREALSLGHSYIGTEHLLLGIIREGEGVACQILVKLEVGLDDIRRRVIAMLDGSYAPTPPEFQEAQTESPAPNKPDVVVTHLLGAVSGHSVLNVEFDHTLSSAEIERIGAAIAEALT